MRGYRNRASSDPVKDEQTYAARRSGQSAAAEINLEPFLKGGKVTIKADKATRLQ